MKNNKTPSQEAQRSKTWNKARTFSHNKLKERPTIKDTEALLCLSTREIREISPYHTSMDGTIYFRCRAGRYFHTSGINSSKLYLKMNLKTSEGIPSLSKHTYQGSLCPCHLFAVTKRLPQTSCAARSGSYRFSPSLPCWKGERPEQGARCPSSTTPSRPGGRETGSGHLYLTGIKTQRWYQIIIQAS